MQKVVNDQLGDWFERNPTEAREIDPQVDPGAAAARVAARKARDADRGRKGLLESASPAGQAGRLPVNDPSECELFIVEGDSAGGSAKGGRDPRTQAILPIRGKILNVEKARIDRVLGNNEVQALISAFGTGIGDDFDLAKLRYHKIVLMADADVDGQHIRTLLLTLLFRFMRPLVEGGHVYLAQPPLYKLKWSQGDARLRLLRPRARRPDRGRPGGRAQAAQGQRRPALQGSRRDERARAVGHHDGPEQRVLLQVTLEDAAAADEIFADPHGRGRRVPPRVHPAQRQGRPVPRHLTPARRAASARRRRHEKHLTTEGLTVTEQPTDRPHWPNDRAGRPAARDAAVVPRLRDVASSSAARCRTSATASSRCTAGCSTRCTTAATGRTAATTSAPASSVTSWASTTRTATPRSTTPWCGWPSRGRCATRWSTARATSARPGNDPAAAMRYTECRMAPLAMEMVRDIDEETVDFQPNYDGQTQEPLILPSRFPNLLVNGSAGIAVGMATNIPPHNLREVADGVQWYLQNPEADARGAARRADGADQRPGLPDRRARSWAAAASRTRTGPAAARSRCARSSRSRRSRTGPAWSSPSCRTR